MIDIDFDTEFDNQDFPTEDTFPADSFLESSAADSSMIEQINSATCDVSQISFGSHIDDLYNPHINGAKEDYAYHIKQITDSDSLNDIRHHAEEAIDATKSQEYWEKCKFYAEIESAKDDIFIRGINGQLDIMERYNKELEDIVFHSK